MITRLSCRSPAHKVSRKSDEPSTLPESASKSVSNHNLFYVVMVVYATAGLLSLASFMSQTPQETQRMATQATSTEVCEVGACADGLHLVSGHQRPMAAAPEGL